MRDMSPNVGVSKAAFSQTKKAEKSKKKAKKNAKKDPEKKNL